MFLTTGPLSLVSWSYLVLLSLFYCRDCCLPSTEKGEERGREWNSKD